MWVQQGKASGQQLGQWQVADGVVARRKVAGEGEVGRAGQDRTGQNRPGQARAGQMELMGEQRTQGGKEGGVARFDRLTTSTYLAVAVGST